MIRNYFLRISVLLCTLFSFSFTQDVVLSLDGSSLNYISAADIYGFQFDHDGCAAGAGGGDAALNGFTVSASSGTVLGFSFTGSSISAGEGTLVDLGVDSGCTQDVLSEFVFSAAPGLPELTSAWADNGGDDDGGSEPTPTVSINSPVNGDAIEGNDIAISVSCTDCEDYHYHAYLDGDMVGMFYQDNFSINAAFGDHTLDVVLADGSHDEIDVSASVSFSNYEPEPENVFVDVLYNSDEDIYGFQFEVGDSATLFGASGGDAADAGFSVSTGGGTVLGFSFSGGFIWSRKRYRSFFSRVFTKIKRFQCHYTKIRSIFKC